MLPRAHHPRRAPFASTGAPGLDVGAIKQKFKRWFWCSVFAQTYERAPNSQAIKDYGELVAWLRGGAPPQSVAQFRFDSEVLSQITPRQRAAYRGFIALVLRHGALDFHKDERITASLGRVLTSHLLPSAGDSPLRTDDFDQFLVARRQLLERELRAVTEG